MCSGFESELEHSSVKTQNFDSPKLLCVLQILVLSFENVTVLKTEKSESSLQIECSIYVVLML